MSYTMTTPVPPPPEPAKPSGLNGRVVVNAIRRRPILFLGVLLLAGAAGAGVWTFLPLPKATAAVVFHVSSREPSILAGGNEGAGGLNSYKLSQAARIKSRFTLNKAYKEPGIAALPILQEAEPNPIDWLERNLEVDSKTGSEFIRVTLEGDDSSQLVTILNAISKAYLSSLKDWDNKPKLDRLGLLQKKEQEYRLQVAGYQEEIDKIAAILGTVDGPTLAVMDLIYKENLRYADRELKTARDELALVRRQIKDFQDPDKDNLVAKAPIPDAVIDRALRQDPRMQGHEADVKQLTSDLQDLQSKFQEGAPAITSARGKLKEAEAARDQYRISQRTIIEAFIRQSAAEDREEHLATLKNKEAELQQKDAVALESLKQVESDIARMNQHRLNLEKYKRLIHDAEQFGNEMARQIEMIKIEKEAPERVQVADEPYPITGLEGNRRLKYTLMVSLGTFFLGFAGMVFWESRSRRVTSTDEVTTAIGVPLLGTVPPFLSGADPQNGMARAVLVEAIDTTRTMLIHGTPGGKSLQTVLVTSAVAGEGKTSLSGHLSISLARAGFRTLLIDGDLQSPAAHGLFELSAAPGLSELLRGDVATAAAIRATPVPGLSVLPAGAVDLAARQALIGDRWRQVRKELEAQFDFVVIDTAPLLMVSDTLLFAREADGVVLSVLLGVSQVGHVSETAARLKSIGANLTGAVVSGVWHDAYRVGYRYGYGAEESNRRAAESPAPVAAAQTTGEGD